MRKKMVIIGAGIGWLLFFPLYAFEKYFFFENSGDTSILLFFYASIKLTFAIVFTIFRIKEKKLSKELRLEIVSVFETIFWILNGTTIFYLLALIIKVVR